VDVHHVIDGLTSNQHMILFARVRELLTTDANHLLPCHRHLLNQDFHHLGNADTLPCQIWVASMESAISAASHVASGHYSEGSMQIFNTRSDAPHRCHNLNERSYPPPRTRPPRPRRPVQQTLPSSFWQTLKPLHYSSIHPKHIKPTSQGLNSISIGEENKSLSSRFDQSLVHLQLDKDVQI
jgi:hypothetical protein